MNPGNRLPVLLSSGILALTAGAKAMALLSGNPSLLMELDPVFNLPTTYVIVAALGFEIALVLLLVSNVLNEVEKGGALLAFCLIIATYRAGAFWIGSSTCPCLGTLLDWAPFLKRHNTAVTWGLLGSLWLCSASVLVTSRNSGRTQGTRFAPPSVAAGS